MSVPMYKRNQSKIEFIHTYQKMRKQILLILMRDFGIKARSYSVNLLQQIYELNDEDKEAMSDIMQRNNISSANVDKYPDWIINHWRSSILNVLNMVGTEIELANSIYISNPNEYFARRDHWNLAIGYCVALESKLHEIIDTIKVKVGQYEIVFELINHEIKLLKGVRKSDNKVLKTFAEKNKIYYPHFDPYCNYNYMYYGFQPVQIMQPQDYVDPEAVLPNRMVEMCKIVSNENLARVKVYY